jgi:hypothetical protein
MASPNIGSTVSGLIPQGSSVGLFIGIAFCMLAFLIFFGLLMFYLANKRKWNLKVEIKLPRSDGRIVNGEWGTGFFHAKRGVVYIKRPGFMQPKIPLKIFDPKRYLQGSDMITVVQLSPVDYRPVLPESFLEHEIEFECDRDYVEGDSFLSKLSFNRKNPDKQITSLKKGDIVNIKESILNIKCDTGHSKAWVTAFEAASKQAYSLKSFFQQFQTPIAIAIVLIAVFVGFAAVFTQL